MSILSTAGSFIKKQLTAVSSLGGGWFPIIREADTGYWQRNIEWNAKTVLSFHAVYECITLIASDIAKLPLQTVKLTSDDIWAVDRNSKYKKLFRKPNRYQNHIEFKEFWMTSKLFRGNTYVLLVRGNANQVTAMYILDPTKVTVLVAEDGSVWYELSLDELNTLDKTVTVPASEIIHDRMNCLFHPLVGISPLYASGLAAEQGLKIQEDSTNFFRSGANPGGVLTAPGSISSETALALKATWDSKYSGANSGKVAVLGDGLTFTKLKMTAADSQLVQQLEWTAAVVASTFKVPAYKIGVGPIPAITNIEALTQQYYAQCLQIHIEKMEACLDEGLGLEDNIGTQLDLDVLFRMDNATLVKTLGEGVKSSIIKVDEARKRLQLPPVLGGNTIYMQQQNYSLAALDQRDRENPLSVQSETPAPPVPEQYDAVDDDVQLMFTLLLEKELATNEYR